MTNTLCTKTLCTNRGTADFSSVLMHKFRVLICNVKMKIGLLVALVRALGMLSLQPASLSIVA